MEIEMRSPDLTLNARTLRAETFSQKSREPAWEAVQEAIDRIFEVGGAVRLITSTQVESPRGGNIIHEVVEMLALPGGRFRLVVSPSEKVDERSKQREWWTPTDAPFVGTERFGDDEHDSRTVCTDVYVAKSLLEDFFTNRQITQRLVDATLSVWTPKPRGGHAD